MASMWTKLAGASQWLCEPQWQSEALLANRLQMQRNQSVLEEQVNQLQSALEETRHMLNHSQRVCQELQLQLKEEQRRTERQEHAMKEQLESQRAELLQLSTELQKAHAALQQQKKELNREVQENDEKSRNMNLEERTARNCETELLSALLECAAMQLTAREEPSLLQKLRTELEVARFMVGEEQETADELRRQSQQLEQFVELQQASLLREHHRHKAFEADVEKFLQQLGQKHPGIARDLAMICTDLPTPYGAGGG